LPWFFPRYVLFILPLGLLVLVQAARVVGRTPVFAGALLVPLAGLSSFGLVQGWFNQNWERDNYRLVTSEIRSGVGLHERVVINSAAFNPAFDRYWQGSNPSYEPSKLQIDEVATAAELERLTAGSSGVWLFQWSSPISDPNGFVGLWLETHAHEIQTR